MLVRPGKYVTDNQTWLSEISTRLGLRLADDELKLTLVFMARLRRAIDRVREDVVSRSGRVPRWLRHPRCVAWIMARLAAPVLMSRAVKHFEAMVPAGVPFDARPHAHDMVKTKYKTLNDAKLFAQFYILACFRIEEDAELVARFNAADAAGEFARPQADAASRRAKTIVLGRRSDARPAGGMLRVRVRVFHEGGDSPKMTIYLQVPVATTCRKLPEALLADADALMADPDAMQPLQSGASAFRGELDTVLTTHALSHWGGRSRPDERTLALSVLGRIALPRDKMNTVSLAAVPLEGDLLWGVVERLKLPLKVAFLSITRAEGRPKKKRTVDIPVIRVFESVVSYLAVKVFSRLRIDTFLQSAWNELKRKVGTDAVLPPLSGEGKDKWKVVMKNYRSGYSSANNFQWLLDQKFTRLESTLLRCHLKKEPLVIASFCRGNRVHQVNSDGLKFTERLDIQGNL
jgi:hypothetical protein